MNVGSKQSEVTFAKVGHCKLVWQIQNIYQYRKLLTSSVDGPDFRVESTWRIPWVLHLGTSKEPEQKGVSLFMRFADLELEKTAVANFRVCVRKQNVEKPLLDEKYQMMFTSDNFWESPVFITSDDFQEEKQNKKFCNFIEIVVEAMWNVRVDIKNVKHELIFRDYWKFPIFKEIGDPFNASVKLLNIKDVGTDLKKFFWSSRFSDTYIKCENEEIPAHKVILAARCVYFAEIINSYDGRVWEGTLNNLAPAKDVNVIKAYLMYLYTGDIESLMKNGPLPLGIYKCAQRMKKFDLEWLTSPLYLCGATRIKSKCFTYELIFDDFRLAIDEGDVYWSECFGNEVTTFTLQIKPCKVANSEPCISLFLWLEELICEESVYIVFDVSVKSEECDLIAIKEANDMKPKNSIGFPELVPINKLSENPDTRLICKVTLFSNNFHTYVEKKSIDCKFKVDERALETSPESAVSEACHGWIWLSYDLGQLLTSESYSDCTIVVGNDRLRAHRVILAARSPYFFTVLTGKEEECVDSSKGMEISLGKYANVDVETMKVILEEIYTGYSRIENTQWAKHIYDLAKFLGLRNLVIKCLQFLGKI